MTNPNPQNTSENAAATPGVPLTVEWQWRKGHQQSSQLPPVIFSPVLYSSRDVSTFALNQAWRAEDCFIFQPFNTIPPTSTHLNSSSFGSYYWNDWIVIENHFQVQI